ncbi:oxidoreductase [Pseudomonas aeruginosa VRFPA02]|nr:oxidoreductase [Pseudomonas aeruginosa VRFPA02]
MTFDVIIVGGSYAGISAGMQLARARRRVLVMDTGLRRNRFARASHGFLGQDGRDPAAIVDDARAQLLAYPSVEWLSEAAVAAKKEADGFVVKAANGERFTAHRLILASGVADELPEIPGLAERWGRHVFHCPYCHGYELDGGPIGVLAASPLAIHHALMLPDWGATTFFLNGVFEPDAEQMSRLDRRGVAIEREAVVALGGARADVTLASGRTITLAGLFTQPRTRMASPLAALLGCEFEDGPSGPFIRTDGMRETSVPGVFACGDRHRGGRRRAHRWRGASFAAVPLTPEADRPRIRPTARQIFRTPRRSSFPLSCMSRHGARHGRPSRGENHEREAARQERPGHHRQHRHRARRAARTAEDPEATGRHGHPRDHRGRRSADLGARQREGPDRQFRRQAARPARRGLRLAAGPRRHGECRHPTPGQRGPAPGQGIQRRRQDGRRHLPRPLAADRRRCRPRQDPDLLFQRAYRPDQRRRGLGRHAGESLPGERLDPDHLAQPG